MANTNLPQANVIRCSTYDQITNLSNMERLGAGHDGFVLKYGDLALKLLKYDLDDRKQKGLMTYEKALYLMQRLSLKATAQPIDVLLSREGIYAGYVMKCFEEIRKKGIKIGELPLKYLLSSIPDLEDDFGQLNAQHVLATDINDGSYICTSDGLRMCDMDKFIVCDSKTTIREVNRSRLHFFIAKLIYLAMRECKTLSKEETTALIAWVKKCCNSPTFLKELKKDLASDEESPISDYAQTKTKMLLRK